MRKGLTSTLMAVAVAILAIQAMAMAPVIKDIPSPVVGNAENTTPANGFVYPDAIDLTKYVTDLESQPQQIVWTYDTVGAPKYKINGVAPIDIGGGEDPVAPPTAKRLNTAIPSGAEVDGDSNPLTITIRNTDLSPNVGQAGSDPGTTGIIAGESQQITFYASDETTFTVSKPVWFYTEAGGHDHLSPGRITCIDYPRNPTVSTGFRYALNGGSGTTSSFNTGNHFCITTTQSTTENKSAQWESPYGDYAAASLPLVKNAAYHIRLIITSSQTDVDKVPLFDMFISNNKIWSFEPLSYNGQNNYGANYFVFSNVGGANAAISGTGTTYDFWWTPSCVDSARWNDETEDAHAGLWAPSNVNNRSGYVVFRILQTVVKKDANGNDVPSGLNSQYNASGTLCLKELTIERSDFSSMQVLDESWSATSLATGFNSPTPTNASVTFTGGVATITPSNGTSDMLAQVVPGDGVYDGVTQSTTQDDFPVPMDLHSTYLVTMDLGAPTQPDADNPPQIMWIGADTVTNELCELSWVSLKAWHHAMPSTTVTGYKAFFTSNYGTNHGGLSQYAWWNAFRPRFMVGNDHASDTSEAKTGKIQIHSVKVQKVDFPQ